MRALVVFQHDEDGSGSPWSAWLRTGWQHVAVCVESHAGVVGCWWVRIDTAKGDIGFTVVAPTEFDLANYYRSFGHTVVETETRTYHPTWKLMPLAYLTCVGTAKRILGIRGWFVVTPWRLHQYLTKGQ